MGAALGPGEGTQVGGAPGSQREGGICSDHRLGVTPGTILWSFIKPHLADFCTYPSSSSH